MKYLVPVYFLFLLSSCKTDYADLPAFSETKQVQVVIETPAGSAHEGRYHPETREFKIAQEAGQDKVIRFLPFPGNAGFIPSTKEPRAEGRSGKALRSLVIAESKPAGTVTEVMPIGVLILEIDGDLSYQVISTPAKPSERLITATTYEELQKANPALKQMLETWFVNHNPAVKTRIMGWKDDRFADELIRRWMK